jgi:hypothetical protein
MHHRGSGTMSSIWRLVGLSLALVALHALHALPAEAQKLPPPTSYWTPKADYVPESERHPNWYTVAGERDGPSMFPRIRQSEVCYEPGDELTFDCFHTVDVMYHWMFRWAEEYPDILDVYEVGRSFEGRPMYQATITNKATGAHTDKPAAYFDGGRHAGEITPSESVLWLMHYVLTNYGSDPEVTEMVDWNTIYLRPQANPDGSNLYLHTAQRNRSSVRPVDQDRNGLLDANPPVDLDGDGTIRLMRWYVGEGEGNAVLDERDESGRLMQRVPMGEGDWRLETEGIDHVGEGNYGSDGIGGLDLHRNFLENWRPGPGMEETGRGWEQLGAGEHPLSEPEIYSLVMWTLTHPHISVVNHMDTSAPFHLRGPSTSSSEERMYPEDLELFLYFDSLGMSITGYPGAGDVYDDFIGGRPLFGHGPDYGYWYYGAIWYGDELWNNARFDDYNDDGEMDDWDRLYWDDHYNEGPKGWKDWVEVPHPQLGTVEVGGFHPKFFLQNPPPHLLEEWAEKQARFNLALVQHLPRLEIDQVDVRLAEENVEREDGVEGREDVYEVTVTWTNRGGIPTALRQAELVKIVRPDRVELAFADELLEGGDQAVVRFGEEGEGVDAGRTDVGETKSATVQVRVDAGRSVEGEVKLLSTRGGVLERPVSLSR